MGLSNHSKDPNKRNTLQPHIWHESSHPVNIGVTSLRKEFFSKDSNDDQLKLNLDCLDEVIDQAS